MQEKGKSFASCRIEQKNGSIIQTLLGDLRFDDFDRYQALTELCEQWSLLYNLCIHVHAKSQKYGELHPKEFLIDVKLTIL